MARHLMLKMLRIGMCKNMMEKRIARDSEKDQHTKQIAQMSTYLNPEFKVDKILDKYPQVKRNKTKIEFGTPKKERTYVWWQEGVSDLFSSDSEGLF
jgi:hypothetical protein